MANDQRGRKTPQKKVENDLMDPNVQVLVAEAGSETVGFIRGEIADRNDYSPRIVGSVSLMYVIERFRRNGIGRCLVKGLCTSFNSKGIEYLTVRYVIGNREAEQFWQELDFDPIIITAMTNPRKLESRL
jgi:predicted acetyltransferase